MDNELTRYRKTTFKSIDSSRQTTNYIADNKLQSHSVNVIRNQPSWTVRSQIRVFSVVVKTASATC